MPRRAEIVAAARGWIGTPWRHQGRAKGVGCDCLGMVVGVARELGFEVADRTDYPRRPDSRELMAGLALHLEATDVPAPGDVVLFEVDRQPQHVGILTDLAEGGATGLGLVHALAPSRKVIEQAFSPGWPGPVVGVWRFPGVTD